MRDDLLLYYERELDYLRKLGVQFAEKHPKVASRLALEPAKCEDPHVERLLEAFAFLTARVHLKLDDEFPEITEALLSVVYPQLVRPIPSMSIVEFQLDPDKGKLTSGVAIPRHTPLYSRPIGGVPCTFRTCYETKLWPVSVEAAELSAPSRLKPAVKSSDSALAIRMELRCTRDLTFAALRPPALRFYLDGESGLVNTVYELLFSRLNRILIRDLSPNSRRSPITLPATALRPVGFDRDDSMVPYPASSFAGHRLLMEYFAFPEKFLFVELGELLTVADAGFGEAIEVIFLLSDAEGNGRIQRLELELAGKNFRLGCSPIANLFPQVAEPIQLNHRKAEYPLVPDVRRPYAVEVFSIDEVAAINTTNQTATVCEAFYSLRHAERGRERNCFWLGRRRPSSRPHDEGTDIFLSLVDLSMQTADPGATLLSVRTTCTNRDLPSRLPFGNQDSDFEMEGPVALKRIVALRKPTAAIRPPVGKGALWRLISHLSLNYLSLVDEGRDALKEILRLYDVGRTSWAQNVIESILEVRTRPHFARLISEQGISLVRGLRVEMELDEERFAGAGAFLFGVVLEHFLGMAVSLNSFTQLSITTPQRREELHTWEPRSGRRILA
jgi:type VI secretion system protein ImpG